MGIEIVRNGVASFFDVLKRLTENLESFDKVLGVAQPIIEFIKLQFGAETVPGSITNVLEDLKVLKTIKNTTFWIFNGDEICKKPISFKDFLTFKSLINLAKRICLYAASILMIGEYLDRIRKVIVPLNAFPWKVVFLLGGVAFSAIKGILDIFDSKERAAALMQERRFYDLSSAPPTEEITQAKTKIATVVGTLQNSLVNTFANGVTSTLEEARNKVAELEVKSKENKPAAEIKQIEEALAIEKNLVLQLKARKLLAKVNGVATDTFVAINKQKDMLELLQNKTNRKQQDTLDDVKTLLKMNDNLFKKYKFTVFDVRAENITLEIKKSWRAVAFDVSKTVVFSIVLTKAPILGLIPDAFLIWGKSVIEGINLGSGLLGINKLLFDSYNKPKEEPRPIFVA